jgi:hypothetical protein
MADNRQRPADASGPHRLSNILDQRHALRGWLG